MDQTLYPTFGNETVSQTLQHRFNNDLMSPEPNQSNRLVFEVNLTKDSLHGIGITIVGGDSIHKHGYGIFVKSVTANGPAFRDGQIKPGDQIIAINDHSLEGIQHHEAVTMIKESENKVKLLISQVKPPGSLDRADSHKLNEKESLHVPAPNEPSTHPNLKESPPKAEIKAKTDDTVNTASEKTDGDEKGKENSDKHKPSEKKDFCEHSNIAEGLSQAAEQENKNSATVDVHSTLSQVDSLHSEVEASEIPADHISGRMKVEVF